MKDMIVVIALVLSFALFVTAHVAITYGLAWKQPRWRSVVAFFVVPAAPYWAWQEKMRVRCSIWVGALVLYVVAMIIARF